MAADLIFDPATVLPESPSKPLGKVVRALDAHVPGFFRPMQPTSGLEASSFHFVKGMLHDDPARMPVYVHAKSHGKNPSISTASNLSIVSGVCLFGGNSLQCFGPGGVPTVLARPGVSADENVPTVVDVRRSQATQIYIPESVARLSRTITALLRLAEAHRKSASVFMHLPGAEYKIMAEAAHASGKITLGALRKYFAVIDAEVEDIQSQFLATFRQAALPLPTFGSPLDHILAPIEPGGLHLDHFTNTPYEHIACDMRGQTMKDIGHASEVVAYQRAVRPGNLPVFIDNHRQATIFNVARETHGFRGVAIYPLPMCVSKQSNDLIYHCDATEQHIARAVRPWL